MPKLPLTVVVITKNEANNIYQCLRSVKDWADEIVIVDDESSDNTVTLAKQYTDKIYHRKMDNEGIHRNWAYAQAKNDWVLSLDADEYVSDELREEISAVLASTEKFCFSIPLRNYIGNYWVKHSGWYPAGKTILFRKSHFRYEEVGVHPRIFLLDNQGQVITDGKLGVEKTGHLTKDIVHKGYPDLEHFLSSLNRQTTLEAQKWITTNRKMTFGKAMWRTIDRFPRRFVGKQGYKDGFYGFMIAYFDSLYQFMSYMKYCEMKKAKELS